MVLMVVLQTTGWAQHPFCRAAGLTLPLAWLGVFFSEIAGFSYASHGCGWGISVAGCWRETLHFSAGFFDIKFKFRVG